MIVDPTRAKQIARLVTEYTDILNQQVKLQRDGEPGYDCFGPSDRLAAAAVILLAAKIEDGDNRPQAPATWNPAAAKAFLITPAEFADEIDRIPAPRRPRRRPKASPAPATTQPAPADSGANASQSQPASAE